MKIVCFASEKGGCGKTTCAVNLGAALAKMQQKILLLDMDPQGSLTYHLSGECAQIPGTIVDVFAQRAPIQTVLVPCNAHLHFVASSDKLSQYVYEDFREPLQQILLELQQQYDYLFLDFPPMRTGFTVALLSLAQQVLIPVEARGGLSLRGLHSQLETVRYVQESLNPALQLTGIIACRLVKRMKLCQEVLAYLQQNYPDLLYQTIIYETVKIAEAASAGKTILTYSPSSSSAQEFTALAKEFVQKQTKGDKR